MMATYTTSPDAVITTPAPLWISPGAGLTPAQRQDSHAVSMQIFIISVSALAIYNAIELAILCFLTFRQYRGLYFYSLLISGLAIIPYTLGFILDLLDVTTGKTRWLAITLITLGWWPMVTGQSLVLWSRLHLLLVGTRGDKIIRWTMVMISVDALIFHIPTTVFTYGSNGNINTSVFAKGYNIMEKIQMTGFFCQEAVLSTIYIVETFKILRTSLQPDTRKTMKQLVAVNTVIILMDLGLLGLEAASLYILETILKGFVYGIKLKLEFAILGKLVRFVGGGRQGFDLSSAGVHYDLRHNTVGFVNTLTATSCRKRRDREVEDEEAVLGNMDHISEFVDLERVGEDVTRPSRSTDSRSARSGRRWMGSDYDDHEFARFEHVEDVTTLSDDLVGGIEDLKIPPRPEIHTGRATASR